MAIESATYINQLDPANPAATDQYADTDNHLRLMKQALKNTFPNITGAITPSHDDINNLTLDPLGQCRLVFGNTSQVLLGRYNGKRLFINGKNETIPAVGVTLANTSIGASVLRYVYAYMSGTTMTLEASATAYATDATYGHKIKSGDSTRTLVGMVRTDASGLFFDTITAVGVASYYNRRDRTTELSASPTTTSTTPVVTGNNVGVLSWVDEVVDMRLSGHVSNSLSGSTTQIDILLDGGIYGPPGYAYHAASGAPAPLGMTFAHNSGEGYHNLGTQVRVPAGGTGSWTYFLSAMTRC